MTSAEIFLNKVKYFKANSDFVLFELQRMLNIELNNGEHQKAKLLGIQAAAGDTTTLSRLCNAWGQDPRLSDFVSSIRRRILP